MWNAGNYYGGHQLTCPNDFPAPAIFKMKILIFWVRALLFENSFRYLGGGNYININAKRKKEKQEKDPKNVLLGGFLRTECSDFLTDYWPDFQ